MHADRKYYAQSCISAVSIRTGRFWPQHDLSPPSTKHAHHIVHYSALALVVQDARILAVTRRASTAPLLFTPAACLAAALGPAASLIIAAIHTILFIAVAAFV
eukprot:188528-Pelagomonas_calceolata.AAC.1